MNESSLDGSVLGTASESSTLDMSTVVSLLSKLPRYLPSKNGATMPKEPSGLLNLPERYCYFDINGHEREGGN